MVQRTKLAPNYKLWTIRPTDVIDDDPVTADEIMAAMEWQIQHPTSLLALESADTVAKMIRQRARQKEKLAAQR